MHVYLIAKSIGLGNGKHRPLKIPRVSFEQVINDVGLPKVFAESILSNNGCFASFVERPKVGDEITPPYLCVFPVLP